MDSIFFNNEPPSSATGNTPQQQQRNELTEKLLFDTTTTTTENHHDYNNNNPPFATSSSQNYHHHHQQDQQTLLDHHHHHHTSTGGSSSSSSGAHRFEPVSSGGGGGGNAHVPPQPQPPQYRDAWATMVFMFFQCIVAYYAFVCGIHNLWYVNHHYDIPSKSNMLGLIYMILLSTLTALGVTCVMVILLMKYAHAFLQIIFGMIVLSNIIAILFFIQHSYWYGIVGGILFLIYVIFCARSYQRRLPFAAANLNVALAAITTNHGLLYIAFGTSIIINFFYSVICILAHVGSFSKHQIDTDDTDEPRTGMLIFLIAMYYWTTEVGKNVIHVTTAGVMGTFWFAPEDASTFWSPAIYDSFYRSITYSFGSICFGSLVTTILHVVHQWIREARSMHRHTSIGPSIILCVLECMSGFLERIITYFNKWAYVYIGLYGYDYLTAGNKVITLFAERGWTAIINDQLVSSVLTLVGTMIGVGAGCVGLLLSIAHPAWVSEYGDSAAVVAFVVPALIGIAMSFILTSVVMAAVDTVVVAFAEAPMEFERNHPGLSSQLVTAWRHVYPDEFGR